MEPRPTYRVLSIRTMALAALAIAAIGAGAATWLLIAYGQGTEADRNQLEAIKTAGTIVLGGGGAGALWLAARRQRTSEIALRQKDLDQALQERIAQAADRDALERRVTDLYSKAADQLGSDTAPVRLAGMYALERLAQNNPDQRQTIVNLLCAYLRMPYKTPDSSNRTRASSATTRTQAAHEEPPHGIQSDSQIDAQQREREQAAQELQVRLTAQRILAIHLHPGDDPYNPLSTFWAGVGLDLAGATLVNLDFTGCHLAVARFSEARFIGETLFSEAQFTTRAQFGGAHFRSIARFNEARFTGDAQFSGTQFTRGALFDGTYFTGGAVFIGTWFHRGALFDESRFNGTVRFARAKFVKGARFNGARIRVDTKGSLTRDLPRGYAIQIPARSEEGSLSDADEQWGHLVHDNNTENSKDTQLDSRV
ncbi:pentapeptide repeat-containing protein [Pseudonocardia acaciae]|uniref:pentapeptide repeat-containing protein n=1 Tax=Pseudonocardia acaciae TaxID=551276 RepID=UPI0009FED2B8|nr:pentapeptide repeat-containing protein [Pseudonocardia acaciae]